MSRFKPDQNRSAQSAAVLSWRLREEAPWRRSRQGSSWASALAELFDVLVGTAEDQGGWPGEISATGATYWFSSDRTSSAINTAIKTHEWLRARREAPHLQHVSCSSAVAQGRAFYFHRSTQWHNENLLLGPAVERAEALVDAANNWAIFVDTVALADRDAVDLIESRIGRDRFFVPSEYLGPVREIRQRGDRLPVTYHEIEWAGRAFGESVNASPTGETADRREERYSGNISGWDAHERRGSIRTEVGDLFYFDDKLIAGEWTPDVGRRVFFVSRPPLADRKQVAGAVVALGESVRGIVVHVVDAQKYGFVEVEDRVGTKHQVFAHAAQNPMWPIPVGTHVRFRVGQNERGAVVVDAEAVDPAFDAMPTRSTDDPVLINDWTEADVRRLYRESSAAGKALLTALAERPDEDLTSKDLAAALGGLAPKGWNSVAGILGTLAQRYRTPGFGREFQPWYLRTDANEHALIRMPRSVAAAIRDEQLHDNGKP